MQRKSSILFLMAAVACLTLLWASTGSAEVILTTDDGSGADTYLSNDTQSGNYGSTSLHGSDTSMAGRIYDTVRMKMPYFKFDISSASGDLTGAYITLYESGGNRTRTWDVYGLNDGTDDSWDEGSISYSNAPGILQPGDGGAAYDSGLYSLDSTKVTLLTTIGLSSSSGTSVSSATSTAMDDFLAADTNGIVSFLIVAQSSDSSASYYFATKENADSSPYPSITLPNVIPEPSTIVLLLMGGLMLLVLRRR